MPDSPLSRIERGALEAWYVMFEIDGKPSRDPTEPLREKGGVFDPRAWCLQAARAIASDEEPPVVNKGVPCPEWAIERIKAAMSQ